VHAQLLKQGPPDSVDQFEQALRFQARNQRLEASHDYLWALQLPSDFSVAAFKREVGRGGEAIETLPYAVAGIDLSQEFDWHVPLFSLPHQLGAPMDPISASVPYLRPPFDRRLPLPPNARGPPTALRVGLASRGNPQQENDSLARCPLPLWNHSS